MVWRIYIRPREICLETKWMPTGSKNTRKDNEKKKKLPFDPEEPSPANIN